MWIEALACEVEVDCADRGFEKAAIVGLQNNSVVRQTGKRMPSFIKSGYNPIGGEP